ncbi:MAG: hypothetical protein JKX97_00715 [Candidatus Lindowbacteria bacterium]|nr:hypothetical protein [Candidatus Lindowbacteria bacterium]
MHYAGKDGIFGKTAPELVNSDNNPVGIDWDNDENAADDFVSTNELVAPLGKPIIVKLSSKDVIHSFGAQFFRVRQDAIHGMNGTLWFTPTTLSVDMADQLAKDLPTYVNDLQASSPPVNWLAAKDYPGYVNEGERLTNEILDRMYNNNKETVFAKPRTPAEIACSQLCGLGHFRMRGVINIVTQKEYDAWVKEQAPTE